MKIGPVIFMAFLTLGCAPANGTDTPPEATVPDTRIGLSLGSVFDTPSPDPVAVNTTDPGELPPAPRPYQGSPPAIPHAIADLLPITREDNYCIDCHLVVEWSEGDPTPIPKSHFVDWRNAPAVTREIPAGARHNCTICHVLQTGAPPLVKNRFADGRTNTTQ